MSRDRQLGYQIYLCEEQSTLQSWSQDFSIFPSREFEGAEFDQIEQLLDIDLSLLRNYPVNYEPDTDRLKYELSMAEEEGDNEKAEQIRQQIAQVKKEWAESYDSINDGWTITHELKALITAFKERILANPGYYESIAVPDGWDYPWGLYFSTEPKTGSVGESRILDDLDALYQHVECAEKHGETYVALIGG